jgi:hypothetical protein
VADLRGVAALAFHDAVVQDDAAADTGGDRQIDQVPYTAAGAVAMLRHGRGVGVILEVHRPTTQEVGEVGRQSSHQWDIDPAGQVGRLPDDPGADVQRPAAGDARGGDVGRCYAGGVDHAATHRHESLDDGLRAVLRPGRDHLTRQEAAVIAGHARRELGATDVQSQEAPGTGHMRPSSASRRSVS